MKNKIRQPVKPCVLSEKLETLGWEIKEIADKFVNFRYFCIVRKNHLCRLIYFKLKFMQLDKAMYQIYIVNAFNFGVGHLRQSQCQIYRVLSTYGWWQYVQKGFFGLFFLFFGGGLQIFINFIYQC